MMVDVGRPDVYTEHSNLDALDGERRRDENAQRSTGHHDLTLHVLRPGSRSRLAGKRRYGRRGGRRGEGVGAQK